MFLRNFMNQQDVDFFYVQKSTMHFFSVSELQLDLLQD